MPGSRTDQDAMDDDDRSSCLVKSRYSSIILPASSPASVGAFAGAMILIWLTAASLELRAQDEPAPLPLPTRTGPFSTAAFPLQSAPVQAGPDGSSSSSAAETKERKNASASANSAVKSPAPGIPSGSGVSEEGHATSCELPADLGTLRVETIRRLKQLATPSTGSAASAPTGQPAPVAGQLAATSNLVAHPTDACPAVTEAVAVEPAIAAR